MYRLLASILTQTTDPATPAPLANEIQKTDDAIKALEKLSFDDAITKIANSLVDFAFKLVIAILVFYVGRFIIRKLFKVVHSLMTNRKMDASLTTFVLSLVNIILYFILIITIVGILGIETSSFLALFASAGVAIGMALSGTLQNFAGGVLILVMHPFRVGDYIVCGEGEGTVTNIGLVYSTLATVDNKAITIPNGTLSNITVTNVTAMEERRVDLTVGISYQSDMKKAKALLEQIYKEHPAIRPEKGITVYVDSLGDSAVVLGARGWVAAADYWQARWDMTEAIKLKFDEEGIEIPFNQLDVHVIQ